MSVYVIKVGGALLQDYAAQEKLFNALSQIDKPVLLVHGGGVIVDELLDKLHLKSAKHNGLRVSPEPHMPYIVGALAGTANQMLCGKAKAAGLKPLGISLQAAGVHARCKDPALGAVGECVSVESDWLLNQFQYGYTPIISSIAIADNGQLLNMNADDAATALASALGAKLILLTDVAAVLDVNMQPIAKLDNAEIEKLLTLKVIKGGMQVKVLAALDAAKATSDSVYIASWKHPEDIAKLINGHAVGTEIRWTN